MDDKTLEADERKPFSAFLPFPLSWAALDLFCPGITALRGWQSFRQTGQRGQWKFLLKGKEENRMATGPESWQGPMRILGGGGGIDLARVS